MPHAPDLAVIRAVLEQDRNWAVYALGDLAPERFAHCDWLVGTAPAPALVLLYRAFDPPILFALGTAEQVRPLFERIDPPSMYLHIRPEILPLVLERYNVASVDHMWRMLVSAATFRPASGRSVEPLHAADTPALQRLYADGVARNEAPPFFAPSMLSDGAYYGVRESDALIAAGGTHLLCLGESLGAIGNVYTRHDCRRRGLGAQVTSAVAADLLRRGLRTVALNVNQRNASAISVYERLGFERYCPFVEGHAQRR